MSRTAFFFISALVFVLLLSAMGVVYAKYESRTLFVELQKVRADNTRAVSEWGRLQLELATAGGHEKVTQLAGARLQMHAPDAQSVVVVRD